MMLNFCVATSCEELVTSDISFLKDYLKAERVDVLGTLGSQFEVKRKLIPTVILLNNGKKIDCITMHGVTTPHNIKTLRLYARYKLG